VTDQKFNEVINDNQTSSEQKIKEEVKEKD
jgi:hypothetical protein